MLLRSSCLNLQPENPVNLRKDDSEPNMDMDLLLILSSTALNSALTINFLTTIYLAIE
jgi:hypothetical protein